MNPIRPVRLANLFTEVSPHSKEMAHDGHSISDELAIQSKSNKSIISDLDKLLQSFIGGRGHF